MSTATKDNAITAAQAAIAGLTTVLHARTFPNATAQAAEDAVVNAALTSMIVGFNAIDYSAPVVITPPMPGGAKSNPVTYSNLNGTVITSLSFDGGWKSVDLLTLNNCQNVHITMCRFSNTNGISVRLNNCTNVTVDYNFFTMVNFGVCATNCVGTKVNFNQGLNLWAPVKYNGNFAHFVQFINCSGAGQQINDNKFHNIDGVAIHAHDIVSIYQTSGTSASRVQIKRNQIKGGQWAGGFPNSGDTGTGITAPDVSGAWYEITDNVVVNSGVNGIICVGTGSNILVDKNIIVNDNKNAKVSYDGFTCTGAKTNIVVSNNRVHWLDSKGNSVGYWFGGGSTIKGGTLTNNNWNDTSLNSSIIPDSFITYK
jgi:hypothetical protein